MTDTPLIDRAMSRRRLLVLGGQGLALVGAGGFLAACGSSSSGGSSSGGGSAGTFVMGYPTVPSQLDPAAYSGNDGLLSMGPVYITPMRYAMKDLGNGYPEVPVKAPEVEPWLAKSLESSKDLKKFKLTLRDDVKSHAGNPLTTQDLVFTIERNIAIPSNGQVIVMAAGLKSPKNFKVIDDHTIEFLTDEPVRLLPQLLQNQFGFGLVDSVEAKKQAGGNDKYAANWLKRNTAGFGAYYVSEYTPQRMQFSANPNFTIEKPDYDEIRWLAVPNPSNRFTLASSGEVDAITELEPEQIKQLSSTKTVKAYSSNAQAGSDQLFFNVADPALKDPTVRLALLYAIPYKGIVESVYRGTATVGETPLGGSQYGGSDPSLNPITEDPKKAEELLSQAGVTGLKLTINFETGSYWQEPAAIQLQTAWKAIGVDVELEGLSSSVWAERLGAKAMQVFMVNLTWFVPDFFYVMNLLFKSTSEINFAGYKNPKMDKIIEAGLAESDTAKRNKLAAEFQKIFYTEPPTGILGVYDNVTAMNTSLTGFSAWINGMVYWPEVKPA
ncbi:MAG: peptide/nickel transport system substrate-binding protein [Solirubrobacterales bacterium]|nr:peptide/nickel transport system substrate-binding protein [Solirubrobacterales bacterium]